MTIFFIPQSPESAVVEHRVVRAAIADGDADRAREAMRDHLTRVETDVEKGVVHG
jgi:DNA-binding FadR family transcriptional regulator